MNKNEEMLQKLRDFRMEQMVKLKNENPDIEVDIEDVIYCGKIELDIDGHREGKDVFLVIKNIDGNIKMEYRTEDDLIAIDYNEMIIPTEEYQYNDFKEIREDKNRISLNELEEERINNISKTTGIDEKDIQDSSSKIDTKKLNEEEILKKHVNIKSEFDPNKKITATENFGNLVPGANKFSKIAVVYSDKTNDKFKMVGITSDGKVEELNGLERTEGVNPTENVVSSNRDGSNIQNKTVQSMYKIKGRPNEGFAMKISEMGVLEVNYFRRSVDDEYLLIPVVEDKKNKYVDSDVRRTIDKTKDPDVSDNIKRAQDEIKNHGNAVIENIDDDPNNDKNHDNIIRTEDGEEKTFDEVIEKIEKEQKVSRQEAERLFRENYDQGETVEKVLDDVDEEIADEMRIPRR